MTISAQEPRASDVAVKQAALDELSKHIDALPMLPQVLVKILQLDPKAEDYFEQFELLAREDPAFAVRVIALSNSAASAPMTPVKSIRDALARVGAASVNSLVASLSVQRVFMPTQARQVRLWQHSIAVAVCSQTIAEIEPSLKIDPGQAYLSGLLHDIGRFVMLEHADEALQKVDESNWSNPDELVQADVDVYKFTHAELGYLACQRWRLPDDIANLVRAHHDPVSNLPAVGSLEAAIAIVTIADKLSMAYFDHSAIAPLRGDELRAQINHACKLCEGAEDFVSIEKIISATDRIEERTTQLLSGLGFV